MRLILFDIDGTLLHSDGAGRLTMIQALQEVFGAAGPIDDYKMSGKVDSRIITDLMTAAGVPASTIAERLPEVYERMATVGASIFPQRKVTPLPGVLALLAALRAEGARTRCVAGLLTGNTRQTAPLKLAAAGIDPAQFSVGAYGSEALDRNRLPAIALARAAELTGFPFDGPDALIVGDTPADVLCARAGGATAVAVATGIYSAASLAAYEPDYLLENLADTTAVLDILLGSA